MPPLPVSPDDPHRSRKIPPWSTSRSTSPDKLSQVRLPKFTLPKIDLPKFDLPKFDLPTFDLPTFDLPTFDTDQITGLARDAAYVGIGAVVVAAKAVEGRGRELGTQITDRLEPMVDQARGMLRRSAA